MTNASATTALVSALDRLSSNRQVGNTSLLCHVVP